MPSGKIEPHFEWPSTKIFFGKVKPKLLYLAAPLHVLLLELINDLYLYHALKSLHGRDQDS